MVRGAGGIAVTLVKKNRDTGPHGERARKRRRKCGKTKEGGEEIILKKKVQLPDRPELDLHGLEQVQDAILPLKVNFS